MEDPKDYHLSKRNNGSDNGPVTYRNEELDDFGIAIH